MKFRFHASNAEGNLLDGEIDAADADDAATRLRLDGLELLSLEPVAAPPGASSAGTTAEQPRLDRREFADLSGHVADVTEARLPLAPALMAVAEEWPPGRYRQALTRIVDQLEAGQDLETVLASHDAPEDLRALVRAGVRSGRLGDVLGEYVRHTRTAAGLRRRALLGLAYPFILLGIGLLIFIGFLVGIVPDFKKIFEDFGTELPALTLGVINLSDLFVHYWLWVLLGVIAVVGGAWLLVRTLISEADLRQLLCLVPVFGPLWRWSSLSRFSGLLGMLLESRVPLPEALVMAGEGTADPAILAACRKLAGQVEQGEPLSEGAYALAGFPASFARPLSRREHQERFPHLLGTLADLFANRARVQTALAIWVCKFFFFFAVIVMMGYLVIAMFLPLIKLLNDLS